MQITLDYLNCIRLKDVWGRSERLAYAYLLYAKNKQMNEEATKRLKAIKEFAQLGSGYKIAMRDLSIRVIRRYTRRRTGWFLLIQLDLTCI